MGLFDFPRLPEPPSGFKTEFREATITFKGNRPLPEHAEGIELVEFVFEQSLLNRSNLQENLRWMDIQAMLTRSVNYVNAMTPGLDLTFHTPQPVPITPPKPPPPPRETPIGDEDDKPTPIIHRGRRLHV